MSAAWLDGAWRAAEGARWPLCDRGLLFGDAVIETLAVDAGQAHFAAEHRLRLRQSLKAVRLPPENALLALNAIISSLPKAPARAALRIMVTAGAGEALTSRADLPRVFALLRERAPVRPLRVYSWRARLGTLVPAAVKHPGYLGAVLARRPGFDEALLLNAFGRPCELTTANVFAVRKGGLYTPALGEGILPGVTRAIVVRLARGLGIAVRETRFSFATLARAEEIFATSSLRGVCPVVRLDARRLPVGPVTQTLAAAYEKRVGS